MNTLIIDSLDRNWTGNNITFDYNFSFNKDNETMGVLYKNYKNVSSVYVENIIVPNIFVDLKSVHCSKKIGLLVGDNGVISSLNLRFPKLSDLKYLVMNIEELTSNINGTNDIINKSTCIFLYESIIPRSISSMELITELDGAKIKTYTNTNIFNNGEGIALNNIHEFVLFKNITPNKIKLNNFFINNLNISLYNPNGDKLELMNDSLTLKKISSTLFTITVNIINNLITSDPAHTSPYKLLRTGLYINNLLTELDDLDTLIYKKDGIGCTLNKSTTLNDAKEITFESRKIEIECNEYFSSEEYKIGDTMMFKNIKGNINETLRSFLERKQGHLIVSLRKNNTLSTLYNIIEILPDIDLDLTTGEETENYFNLQGLEIDISGNLINKDNQHVISINIETE
tara:strand:+ start:480 stop:1679 length:1200 start_codon:yes stop_codon:yes gene_type:complete